MTSDFLMLSSTGGYFYYQVCDETKSALPASHIIPKTFSQSVWDTVEQEFDQMDKDYLVKHPNTTWTELAKVNFETTLTVPIIFDSVKICARRVPFMFSLLMTKMVTSVDGVKLSSVKGMAGAFRTNFGTYSQVTLNNTTTFNSNLLNIIDLTRFQTKADVGKIILGLKSYLKLDPATVNALWSGFVSN